MKKNKEYAVVPIVLYFCNQQRKCSDSSICGTDCVMTGDLLYSKNYSELPPNEVLRKNFKKKGKNIWIEKGGNTDD